MPKTLRRCNAPSWTFMFLEPGYVGSEETRCWRAARACVTQTDNPGGVMIRRVWVRVALPSSMRLDITVSVVTFLTL